MPFAAAILSSALDAALARGEPGVAHAHKMLYQVLGVYRETAFSSPPPAPFLSVKLLSKVLTWGLQEISVNCKTMLGSALSYLSKAVIIFT